MLETKSRRTHTHTHTQTRTHSLTHNAAPLSLTHDNADNFHTVLH